MDFYYEGLENTKLLLKILKVSTYVTKTKSQKKDSCKSNIIRRKKILISRNVSQIINLPLEMIKTVNFDHVSFSIKF